MIRITVLAIILLGSLPGISQKTDRPIEFTGDRPYLTQDGSLLRPKAIEKIIQNDEEASAEFKRLLRSHRVSTAMAFAGGFGLGFALANIQEEYSVPMLGASGFLIVGAGIFYSKYKKGAVEVAKMYNNNLKMLSSLQFDVGVNGVSFSLNF